MITEEQFKKIAESNGYMLKKWGTHYKCYYYIDINGNLIAEYDHVHKVVMHWMGEDLKPKYNDKEDKLEIGVYFPITCVKAKDFDYCLGTFRKNLKKMMKEIRINRIKKL